MAVFGAAVAAIPGLAGAQAGGTPTVTANNDFFAPTPTNVPAGGQVRFADVTPLSYQHDVLFVAGPTTPACDPSLPRSPSAAAWSGSCTFALPGTYTFICDKHGAFDQATGRPSGMHGTIIVTATNTTVTTTTPSPALVSGLSLRASQHGTLVKASIVVGADGSSLSAQLLASGRILGRLERSSVAAGRVRLAIRLNPRGRRALARRHSLALRLRVTVTGPSGGTATVSRRVGLRV